MIDLPEFFEDHREEPPIFGGSNMADFWLWVYSICISDHLFVYIYTHTSLSLSIYMYTYTIDLYTHILYDFVYSCVYTYNTVVYVYMVYVQCIYII